MRCPQWMWKSLLKRHWPAEFLSSIAGEGLEALIAQHGDLGDSAESPIFLFSAGWRSGSTLLQRLLNSNPDVMVWGEAYEHSLMLYHLSAPLSEFTMPRNIAAILPEEARISSTGLSEILTHKFIATLTPPAAALKRAHRAHLETLFREWAFARGRTQWGIKMVRGTAVIARYLRWLYPKARLLFLYRNPYSSFRSYINHTEDGCRPWYLYYPSHQVRGATPFAVHWRHCVEGFLASHRELNAFLISYESLTSGERFDALQDYLGFRIDSGILEVRADLSGAPPKMRRLTTTERTLIHLIAGGAASKLGYSSG
ncbi:MAG: sulfotransferase [Blastocatellia bacterium]